MTGEWQDVRNVPRDGRVVILTDHDTFTGPMFWNPTGTNPFVQRSLGIWELLGGGLTWSEAKGFGPTHWKPYEEQTVALTEPKSLEVTEPD